MEEAKKTSEPTIIVQSPPAYNSSQKEGGWRTSGNVRTLIIAVAAITVTAMVITGFVLGFKYHADSTKHALRNKEEVNDDNLQETIESDEGSLTKLYTVRTEDGSYFVLYDYARNIRVMKSHDHCVVTPMNSSESDPETEYRHGTQTDGDFKVIFKRDNMPVRDTSFLGPEGEKLCAGNLVYWGLPKCADDDEMKLTPPQNSTEVDAPGRQKRQSGSFVGGNKYWCNSNNPAVWCCIDSSICGKLCSQCVTLYKLLYYAPSPGIGYNYHCHWVYGC